MLKKKKSQKIGKSFKLKKNEDRIHEKLWDAAKAVSRGKFVALNCQYQKRMKVSTPSSKFPSLKYCKNNINPPKKQKEKNNKRQKALKWKTEKEKINEMKCGPLKDF